MIPAAFPNGPARGRFLAGPHGGGLMQNECARSTSRVFVCGTINYCQKLCRSVRRRPEIEPISEGKMGWLLKWRNERSNSQNERLIKAAANGQIETVVKLLAKGADVHADHDEALIKAIKGGHTSLAKILLKSGANYSDRSLRVAVHTGNSEIVETLLMMAGANPLTCKGLWMEWAEQNAECENGIKNGYAIILEMLHEAIASQNPFAPYVTLPSYTRQDLESLIREAEEEQTLFRAHRPDGLDVLRECVPFPHF